MEINTERAPELMWDPKQEIIEDGGTGPRVRSSLRQRYEAEARVIERRVGNLESVREQLGLSQRKMAQLLLVDPSAWTRWTQGQTAAPPHIWRALAWYLALQDKYPALDAAFWLNGVARAGSSEAAIEQGRAQAAEIQKLRRELDALKRQLETHERFVSLQREESLAPERFEASATSVDRETKALARIFLALTLAGFLYLIVRMAIS
ncbi:MAG: helix-turn-helix domain-containing protein [Bdellovibrionales bacterium]|nr:helix-turn-helix domain-containing protein [Bdellovibrionales bacterium]